MADGIPPFFLFFALFYVIPFLIGSLLPNKKWLVIYTVIILTLTAYTLYDLHQTPEAKRFDGPGGVFSLIFSILLVWGTYAGIIGRWLTLLLNKHVPWKYFRLTATLIAFLSLPFWHGASYFSNKWEFRPPSKECEVQNLNLVLAGYEIKVAPMDLILADTSDGTGRVKSRLNKLYSNFSTPHAMRKYCDATREGKTPLSVNNVYFGFSNAFNSSKRLLYITSCQNDIGRWPRDRYCDKENKESMPPNFSLFDRKKYDNNPYDKKPENYTYYEWYLEHKSEYSADPEYPDFLRNGKEVFWISKSIRVGNNQELLAAMCGFADEYSKGNISCSTVYQLTDDIYIDYRMKLSWENPEKDAQIVHDKVNEFISFLGLNKER